MPTDLTKDKTQPLSNKRNVRYYGYSVRRLYFLFMKNRLETYIEVTMQFMSFLPLSTFSLVLAVHFGMASFVKT